MIDLDLALKSLDGDRELLQDCLTILSQDLPQRIDDLERAFRARDMKAVCNLAHSIKGSVAVVGARDLKSDALAVELAAKDEQLQQVEQGVRDLQRHWGELRSYLQGQGLI